MMVDESEDDLSLERDSDIEAITYRDRFWQLCQLEHADPTTPKPGETIDDAEKRCEHEGTCVSKCTYKKDILPENTTVPIKGCFEWSTLNVRFREVKKGTEINVRKDRDTDETVFVTALGPPVREDSKWRLPIEGTKKESVDEDISYRINIGKDWLSTKVEGDSLWEFAKKASWQRKLLVDNTTLEDRETINADINPITPEKLDAFLRPKRLNTSQRYAVEMANKYRLIFIQGPPGTGKTETVAEIVALSKLKYERIGVFAQSNVGVDTALQRCELKETFRIWLESVNEAT